MRVKQRVVLWGALTALVVGAVGLVVASGGDGGEDAPALPLSVGSGEGAGQGGDEARAASVAPLDLAPRTTYVAADGLPALGGREAAHRLPTSVDAATVRELARALGIEAEPTEDAGTWHAAGGGMVLDVHGPAGSWLAYRDVEADQSVPSVAPDAPAGTSSDGTSSPGGGECVERNGVVECTAQSSGSASASASGSASATTTACPADPAVGCPEQPAPEPPADLPSEDEARRIALDLLAAAGTGVEDADVRVDDGGIQWSVAVEPSVGGLPAPGLAAHVAVGAGGRIDTASGYLGPPEELGDYDLLDTRAALDRLNDQSWGYRTMGPADGPVSESFTASASQSQAPSSPVTPETTVPPGAASGGGDVPAASPETTVAPGAGPSTGAAGPGAGSASGGGSAGSAGSGDVDASVGIATGGGDQPRTLPAPADEVPPSEQTTVPGDGAGQIAPGEPTPGGPPAPAPEPEPVEVTVTDAEVVLVAVPSWDGTGTYLVPGYRFTADDGSEPMVPAITDDALAPAPDVATDEPVEPVEPGGPEEDAEPVPLPAPVEPQPLPAPGPTVVEP